MARLDDEELVTAPFLTVLVFLSAVFLFPVARTLLGGLGMASAGPSLFFDPFLRHVVGFTYAQAFLSAVLSAVIGTAGALLYSEGRFCGRQLLWRLSFVAFSLPTILVVLALISFWGKNILGWPGILLAHSFLNFPIFLKNVGTALSEIDRSEEKAALSLGAGRLLTFFKITLFKILPSIRSAFFISFLFASASFLPALMLGGGPRFTTIEVAIYQALKVDYDPALAGQLAMVQLTVSLLIYVLFLHQPFVSALESRGKDLTPVYWFRSRRKAIVGKSLFAVIMILLVVGPLLTLGWGGITALPSFSWSQVGAPLVTSLELAFLSTAVAIGISLPLAYCERHSSQRLHRSLIGLLSALPLTVSPIVLALALSLSYPEWMQQWRGSLIAIAVIQGTIASPLGYRFLHDGLWRIPEETYQAAASLGATRGRVFLQLEVPLLRKSLAGACLSGAAFSLGEIGVVMLFISEKIETLPLGIFRMMDQYRFPEAYLLSGVMILVMSLLYWLMGLTE